MGEVTTTSGPSGRRIRGLDAEERQAQRRRDLLEAALELFAAKGYPNTSIEQICQTAFVSTKSFYELFDGKEACYLALLVETSSAISDKVVAAFATAPADQHKAALALVSAFAHGVVDDPRVARATFGTAGGISAAVEAQRRSNRRWAAEFLEGVWGQYGLAGPPGTNLHRVAVGVVGGLFDLVVDWLHDAADDPAGDIDRLIEDLLSYYNLVSSGLANHARR